MQKVFNLMAVFSFCVSGATAFGAWYLYKNSDTLIEQAREKAVEDDLGLQRPLSTVITRQCSWV